MERPFIDRIHKRLEVTGKSVRKAALDAGLSETALKDLLANKKQSPKIDTLQKLAASLETDPAWLAFGIGDDIARAKEETARRGSKLMSVNGEVAAGHWLEIDEFVDESRFDPVPITADERWPEKSQYGLVVRGTSINRFAIDGDTLHCIDLATAGLHPQSGDLVIVERAQAGGHLRERTAKRYYLGEHAMAQLRPDSDDPRWQEPIDLPYRIMNWQDPEGVVIEIKAVVVGAYRPVQRRAGR